MHYPEGLLNSGCSALWFDTEGLERVWEPAFITSSQVLLMLLVGGHRLRTTGTGQSHQFSSVQFIPVAQLYLTLCNPMACSTPGLPVHHQHLEFTQTQVHWVGDAIQPSHPLSSPSPPTFNLSQHQGLFKWVSSSHQVAKGLEFQLQHQSFQWIFRTDFL